MVAAVDNNKPVIEFYPYQRDFFDDTARVQVGIWCRQAGKDFTSAAKAVDHALRTGQAWYIVSLTQRQADATFAKCKAVSRVFRDLLKIAGKTTESERIYIDRDREIDEAFRVTARTLHLPGGGSVTALPGRDPDTLAGLTGNVIFTEFGLFPKGGYDHWRVVFPLTTRGYKVIVISTPRGKGTKFHELVNTPEKYSVHFVDIHRAVADGMPLVGDDGEQITIEEFRDLYGDETGWQREYLCQFTGDLSALVNWLKLIEAADDPAAAGKLDYLHLVDGAGWRADFFKGLAAGESRAEIGWDVARHADLSIVWVNVRRKGQRRLRYMVVMERCSFALQREVVRAAMDTRADNVGAGDATGMGMDSNETLATAYGDRWLGVTFTAASKAELGSLAVTAFDDNDQGLPPLDGTTKWIGNDIYAVQRDESGARMKLVAQPNSLMPASHCDAAFAFMLARKAMGIKPSTAGMWVAD